MIRISDLKLKINYSDADLKTAIFKKIHFNDFIFYSINIEKKSLDARDKNNIHWNITALISTDKDNVILKKNNGKAYVSTPSDYPYRLPLSGSNPYNAFEYGRIVVVGSGPAGLFAAYNLAKEGFCPLLIERGESVEDRINSVNKFWETNILNPESNIQFGEGGAGTFSDGKLNTGVHDKFGRNKYVLETFVENGAPQDILYDNKPHLGTDNLMEIVKNMRERIISFGGEVLFNTKLVGINTINNEIDSIEVLRNGKSTKINTHNLVLAIGHSARDTFRYILNDTHISCEAKPFAVGLRIQHLQDDINKSQYGDNYEEIYGDSLPVADYKLVGHGKDNRAVYSFCMCPGGFVVNSSSTFGMLCVNGMSYSKRDSQNANSAIVVSVSPSNEPETNIMYQEELEKNAYELCKGKIPVQRFEDFKNNRETVSLGKVHPEIKGQYGFGNLNRIFDIETADIIKDGIDDFGKKIKCFNDPDSLLAGVETRTSSPIRILRDEDLESNIRGIYPCGEGAGYAGGITSAAIDGVKVFEKIYSKYAIIHDYYLG